MRFLVSKGVFSAQFDEETSEVLYGLTHSSKWLVTKGGTSSDNELITIAPMVMIHNHPWVMNQFHHFSDCVKDGGLAFEKANGHNFWDMTLKYPEFKKVFNNGMASTANVIAKETLVDHYKAERGFEGIRSLVDVGGGTGTLISEIIKANPQVRGINFDLPHVIATAPEYLGVKHVGGDMFVDIPQADAVIMKWVMHNWSDDDCVKILKNCHKAIPKIGKVIIIDVVLKPSDDSASKFQNVEFAYDMLMMALTKGGKERTEQEWKLMLKDGGFPRYKIIQIPTFLSILEAYPE